MSIAVRGLIKLKSSTAHLLCAEEKKGDNNYLIFFPQIPCWFLTDRVGRTFVKAFLNNGSREEAIQRLCRVHSLESSKAAVVSEAILRFIDAAMKRNTIDSHRESPPIRSAALEITNACNLKCLHCYSNSGLARHGELTSTEWSKIIDRLSEESIRSIDITGGEPLVKKGIQGILDSAYDVGTERITLLTNGTLITEKIAKKLARYSIVVQVSIDGSIPQINDRIRGRGSYKRAIKGLKHLVTEEVKSYLSLTILRPNLSDHHSYIEFAQRNKVAGIRLGLPQPVGRLLSNSELMPTTADIVGFYRNCEEFLVKHRRKGKRLMPISEIGVYKAKLAYCLKSTTCVTANSVHVRSDGEVLPCPNLVEKAYSIGNVKETKINEMWSKSDFAKFLCSDLVSKITACSKCQYVYLCGGGCRGVAMEASGNILSRDPHCPIHKRLFSYFALKIAEELKSPFNMTSNAILNRFRK